MDNPNTKSEKIIYDNFQKKKRKLIIGFFVLIIIFLVAVGFVIFKNKTIFQENENFNEEQKTEDSESMSEKQEEYSQIIADEKRKESLDEIKNALETYQSEKNTYPISNEFVKLNDENSFVHNKIIEYVDKENLKDPKDPEFYYGYKSDGNYFELTAKLENPENEDCELINSITCIYKIKSEKSVEKVSNIEILTVENVKKYFQENLEMIMNDEENSLIVTNDNQNDVEKGAIEELKMKYKNMKVRIVSEVTEEELSLNNILLVGNTDSNSLFSKVYGAKSIISIGFTFPIIKFSESPWNADKMVFMYDYRDDPYKDDNIISKGVIVVEEKKGFYHIKINQDDGISYALISNYYDDENSIINLVEFNNKRVEIDGRKIISNSKEFKIEDGILVYNVKIIE
ncbi:MAG: hypothetical protein P1P85_03300 [Patescibacteria group bacterium]|nr:hypothetical protein [Patescibacteria group bacterium]